MHELAVTQNLVDIALDAARDAGATQIRAIHVVVGALTGIAPESVRFYFDFLSDNTAAAGAHLDLTMQPAQATCADCRATFSISPPLDLCCPQCGGAPGRVIGGNELLVQSIEVD
jgi:hydrogenase nickel incorporation protein HypA/HybF